MSAAALVREVDETVSRIAEAPMRYLLAEHGASSFNGFRIVCFIGLAARRPSS